MKNAIRNEAAKAKEGVVMEQLGGLYSNRCGGWGIRVSEPHPAWVTILWGGVELQHIQVEDLRDLRHLIGRAEAAIVTRDAE
jgi:hypothetical protein